MSSRAKTLRLTQMCSDIKTSIPLSLSPHLTKRSHFSIKQFITIAITLFAYPVKEKLILPVQLKYFDFFLQHAVERGAHTSARSLTASMRFRSVSDSRCKNVSRQFDLETGIGYTRQRDGRARESRAVLK